MRCIFALFGVLGADAASAAAEALHELSFEQLAQITVSSVSKKDENPFFAPAATAVISNRDIAASGATVLPETLRGIPGLEVAQDNAHEWAVTARSFNSPSANKLLVLMDGRSVYTPHNSGVFWHVQDVMLEDIERIEVVRGPGGALWGANAVNGIVNVLSKDSRDTQGTLMSLAAGSDMRPLAGVRQGGRIDDTTTWRAHAQYANREPLQDAQGDDATRNWYSLNTGARFDVHDDDRHTMMQAGYSSGSNDDAAIDPDIATQTNPSRTFRNSYFNAFVLGRYSAASSPDSSFRVQTYADRSSVELLGGEKLVDTFDLDFQQHVRASDRHDVVWGGGYRFIDYTAHDDAVVRLRPESESQSIANLFIEDDITLSQQLHLRFGGKLEYHDVFGWQPQPSARIAWAPGTQFLWGAVSQAVRLPSRIERHGIADLAVVPSPGGPVILQLRGNPLLEPEKLIAYEAGYRALPRPELRFDLAAWFHSYDELRAIEPVASAPALTLTNNGRGDAYGASVTLDWIRDPFRIGASYTGQRFDFSPPGEELNSPEHRFSIRAQATVLSRFDMHFIVHYTDELPGQQVDAYWRVDTGGVWRIDERFELSVWGQNLTESRHREFNVDIAQLRLEVPRSVYGKIVARF